MNLTIIVYFNVFYFTIKHFLKNQKFWHHLYHFPRETNSADFMVEKRNGSQGSRVFPYYQQPQSGLEEAGGQRFEVLCKSLKSMTRLCTHHSSSTVFDLELII